MLLHYRPHHDANSPARLFVEEHQDALAQAAERLAGRRGALLVADLVDRLGSETHLSRATHAGLHQLLDVLSLERVHDPDREESVLFADVEPTDPVVEEICLLTDQLRDALAEADLDQPPASRRAAA